MTEFCTIISCFVVYVYLKYALLNIFECKLTLRQPFDQCLIMTLTKHQNLIFFQSVVNQNDEVLQFALTFVHITFHGTQKLRVCLSQGLKSVTDWHAYQHTSLHNSKGQNKRSISCGTFSEHFFACSFWFNPDGTTPLR